MNILIYGIIFSFLSFFIFIFYDIARYNSDNYFDKITKTTHSQYALNIKEKNQNMNDDKGIIINDYIMNKQKDLIKANIAKQIDKSHLVKKDAVGVLIADTKIITQKNNEMIDLNAKDFASLDEFMNKNIELFDEQIKKQVIVASNFKYLNEKNLQTDEFFVHEIKQGRNMYEVLRKMQNITIYLSNTYGVSMQEMEKIVLLSYKESYHNKIDPALLLSIISVESSFRKNAQSWAGAIGLTQVIPYWHQDKIQKFNLNVNNMEDNISLGAKIIREYITISGGNVINGLQRYNGTLHDTTRKYSSKVMDKMQKLKKMFT